MTLNLQQMLNRNAEEIAEATRQNAETWEGRKRKAHIDAATAACHLRYDRETRHPGGSTKIEKDLCQTDGQPCSPERCCG